MARFKARLFQVIQQKGLSSTRCLFEPLGKSQVLPVYTSLMWFLGVCCRVWSTGACRSVCAARKDKMVRREDSLCPTTTGQCVWGHCSATSMTERQIYTCTHMQKDIPTAYSDCQGCHSYLLSVSVPSSSLFCPSLPPSSYVNLFQSIVITWKKKQNSKCTYFFLSQEWKHTHTHTHSQRVGWGARDLERGCVTGENEVK